MAQKKKAATTPSRDRVVYEVRGPNGSRQVEATSTADLKKALLPLLGLDSYSTQAAAHLAHVERATVNGKGWSVRRLGVLAFVADTDDQPAPTTARRSPAAPPPSVLHADADEQPIEPSPLEGQGF